MRLLIPDASLHDQVTSIPRAVDDTLHVNGHFKGEGGLSKGRFKVACLSVKLFSRMCFLSNQLFELPPTRVAKASM